MEDLANTSGDGSEYLTAQLGKKYMVRSDEIITTEAGEKHLQAFEEGCQEWMSYHSKELTEEELAEYEQFVTFLLSGRDFKNEKDYESALSDTRKQFRTTLSKPQISRAYHRLRDAGKIEKNASFDRLNTKKSVRSNSGVVVITVVTAPGKFSCPADCYYCPDEPGQPRSYLSTEPAVARANQNEFDPVRQFYDRAGTLAKQGHTVDKIEIIVLGGTWSYYPKDYQEQFCRDLFYAANTFDEHKSKLGARGTDAANARQRLSLLEEQQLNEVAAAKIIGLTLETRPDHINAAEIRRFRQYGCTRVQLGVQHTDDNILKHINRGHDRKAAVKAVKLLKVCGYKADIHLMPDLPSSNPDKDWDMFQDVLHGDELQADHWKIYPCEITPFTRIEDWYKKGAYMPYTETDPRLLIDLLARVKAEVHPWIRLNRVIRDIPEVSIIAGNSNTNLRQCIFEELKKRGKSCRCIRCREVRDWPETPDGLRLRVREYRSSGGTEYFISIEGSNRGLGGGATQRALGGGQKATKKEKSAKKKRLGRGEVDQSAEMIDAMKAALADGNLTREERKLAAEAALAARAEARAAVQAASAQTVDEDVDNATLYGLLRLRFNDDPSAPSSIFPELRGCAMIRELHVYGVLVAAGPDESRPQQKNQDDERPQHIGIGRTLMGTAELIAAAHGWKQISVIAGVGVRNYYRKLGYVLKGKGQYLIKDLPPCPASDRGRTPQSFETSFVEAGLRVRALKLPVEGGSRRSSLACTAVVTSTSLLVVVMGAIALTKRWRQSSS
jgi:ELP3 family radical SAM enzyme/protein acetyltransferase